jgi:HK97 family phage major capsid protein
MIEMRILNLYYSLDEKYTKNACFLMSRSAEEKIRKLKDSTNGQYLWNPSLLDNVQGTLLGCPVYTTQNLEAVGPNKESIIFGDFKYYQIVDKMGIKILRDPYTAKPFVRFYTTKKVGGDVVKTEAFKILRTSSYNG